MADIHAKVGEPEAASERYDEALGLLTTLGHRNAQRIRTKRAALADDR
jgi:hypothetical protein